MKYRLVYNKSQKQKQTSGCAYTTNCGAESDRESFPVSCSLFHSSILTPNKLKDISCINADSFYILFSVPITGTIQIRTLKFNSRST